MQTADIWTQIKRKRNKKLVKNEEEKQVELYFVVPDNKSDNKTEDCINNGQHKF